MRYVYSIIPDSEEVKNDDTIGGRWAEERTIAYINKLFKKYNYNIEHINYNIEHINNTQIYFDTKLSENVLSELKIESPNIIINYICEVDIFLDEIVDELKRVSCLAIKYNVFDIANDINSIISSKQQLNITENNAILLEKKKIN
jgi:ribosome-interacting GTPase 1